MMALGINWDDEDALYAPKVVQPTVKEVKVEAAGVAAPPVGVAAPQILNPATPSSAVGQAAVPPAVSTAQGTGSPLTPSTAATPPWVTNAASSGGDFLRSALPIIDPRHYDANGQLDQGATAAHAVADAAVAYGALKTIQGVGSGISRKISNVIGGVDPTIQAQIDQANKQAARAAREAQGKVADPIATPRGRIEPTLLPDPPPMPSAPEAPKPPVTPAEKAALAVAEPSPLEAEKTRLAKIKADMAQIQLERLQQKGGVPPTAPPVAVPPEVPRTLDQTAALAKTLTPPVSATTPVVTPLPIETSVASPTPSVAPAAAPAAPAAAPKATEITGKAGDAVSPKTRAAKTTITYKDTPDTWQKLTKEGTTFLPGYGKGDNNLFNTYGAEGRKAILEKFNNGKPIGDYKNYEELIKKLAKGVPIGDVPDLMKKLPAEAEAGNYGKLGKALKIGGIAGLGLSLSELANAKSIPEFLLRSGDIATDYLPVIGQFKQGMSGSTLSSGTLDSPEFREMMKRAKPTGAVPPPR